MCGIAGYKAFKHNQLLKDSLQNAVSELSLRGPDNQAISVEESVGLGHTRLSIIDTSEKANQPMMDPSGGYTLIFNGEIYNYKQLQAEIPDTDFKSTSDTEVLLYLLIKHGESCLDLLNGFFALAFYDKEEDCLLIARDRMGIKPLHYYHDSSSLFFGSEMKAILSFPIEKKINKESLYWYLKLNYLPGDLSMIQGVKKLPPGSYLIVKGDSLEQKSFLEQTDTTHSNLSYKESKSTLLGLLEQSVKRRLVADVPLGAFLSGGTDSSAIVSLASKYTTNLSTFSIGYKDQPFFDETKYANLVASKFNTNHTVFSLTNDDLLNDLDSILNYIDEPFADSSAIPTYILSKHTKKHVKVALSGDGADELFGGYYKHLALSKALNSSFTNRAIKGTTPLLKLLPKSRSGKWSNLIRRLVRYGSMLKLDPHERYWFLASLTPDPNPLLIEGIEESNDFKTLYLSQNPVFNDYLKADTKLVLPGDMLTKVDLMSMANSLEVRVPFLDKEVVAFAQSLPNKFKVNGNLRKAILQDTFKEILPAELYNRPKKGFEIPLLQWMRNELLTELDNHVFNEEFLHQQRLFNVPNVMSLRKKLQSRNPEDVHGTLWSIYIFQKWYLRWFMAKGII